MSSNYFFKLDKNSKNKKLLDEFYLSWSNMLYSEILLSKWIQSNTDNYYRIITSEKFELIEDEIKAKLNNLTNSLIKEIWVIFMAKLDWLNQKKFDKLQKHFVNKLLTKFKNNLNLIINNITKIWEDKKNIYFDIVLLNSLLIEISSERILKETWKYEYQEFDLYKKFTIIKNSKLIEKLNNTINKYILENKENSFELLSQIIFLQDIFLKYPNTYIDKEYIYENLTYYYDEIISLLKLLLFIRVWNVTKTDIIYG